MIYKAIFFDADGVALRSARLFSEQLELDHGIKNETLQPFFTGIFRECGVGNADLKEELAKVIKTWGWRGTVEELVDYWFTSGTQPEADLLAYVVELRRAGMRCYLTTDQEKYRGEHLRSLLGGGHPFDEVYFSAELGVRKKDPKFFEFVYSKIKIATMLKSDVLVVDDDEKNLEVVKALGFDAHLFTSLDELKSKTGSS